MARMNTLVFTCAVYACLPSLDLAFNIPDVGGSSSSETSSSSVVIPGSFDLNPETSSLIGGSLTLPGAKGATTSNTLQLNNRITTLNDTVKSLVEEILGSKCNCGASDTVQANADAISSLKSQISTLNSESSGQQSSIDAVAASVSDVSAAIGDNDFQSIFDGVNQKINSYNTNIEDIQQIYNNVLESGVTEASYKTAKDSLDSLTTHISSIASDTETCSAQCSEAVSAAGSGVTSEQMASIQTTFNDFKTQFDNLPSYADYATVESVADIEAQLSELQNMITQTQSSINSISPSELSGRITDVQSAVDTATAGIGAIQNDGVSHDEFQSLQDTLATLETKLANAKTDAEDVSGDLSGLITRAETAMTSVDSATSHLQTLTSHVGDYEYQLASLGNQAGQAESAASNLGNEMQAELSTLQSKISDLNDDMDSASKTASDGASQISSLQSSIDTVQNKVDSFTAMSNEVTNAKESVNAQSNSIEDDIADLDVSAELNEFNTLSSTIDSEFEDLKLQMEVTCPWPFTHDTRNNVCYYINYNKLPWYRANIICEAIGGPTAHLVNVDNESKRSLFVDVLWWEYLDSFWVGLHKTDDGYSWIGGNTNFDTHWNPGEPNEHYYIQCGQLTDPTYYGHALDDTWCDDAKYSICEIPMD